MQSHQFMKSMPHAPVRISSKLEIHRALPKHVWLFHTHMGIPTHVRMGYHTGVPIWDAMHMEKYLYGSEHSYIYMTKL